MPLVLRDRVGLFAIFPLSVVNILVSTVFLVLYRVEPTVSVVLAWAYAYVLLLQTRLMVVLLISGWIVTPQIAQYTDAITMFQATYSMTFFSGCVIVAHLVAFGISAITGFRI